MRSPCQRRCMYISCTPQVSLLDPVTYPSAIKAFAKEVCRNDLLNFGRLHFFFPDSRLALDLNTDKTLKVLLRARAPALATPEQRACVTTSTHAACSAGRGTSSLPCCSTGHAWGATHVAIEMTQPGQRQSTHFGCAIRRRRASTGTSAGTSPGAGTSWRSWPSGDSAHLLSPAVTRVVCPSMSAEPFATVEC